MKNFLTTFALFFAFFETSYGQIVFEEGYLVNNAGERISCFIKNVDWKNNPEVFEYKMPMDDSVLTGSIRRVREFGIDGVSRYVRAKVEMDKSLNELANLSTERNPVFWETTLFLKVLVEGKASLYSWENDNYKWFFYQLNDSAITQLVYKRYRYKENYVGENNLFRQQLKVNMACPGLDQKTLESMSYTRKNLEDYFVKYNNCFMAGYTIYESKNKKDLLHLTIRPGLNFNSLEIMNSDLDVWDTDFGKEYFFRLGAEAELILPFNKNKWGIILEPTFQSYVKEKKVNSNLYPDGAFISNIDYKSIEVPLGLRHYFFLSDTAKIFVNASVVVDFSGNSSIWFSQQNGSPIQTLAVNARRNLAFGIGYKYKEKYSMEVRYHTNREILGDYVFWNSKYSTLSFIFGYTLF
ncbi:MAG: hypothetical protein U0T82_00770 [Bacteroidales bacterium]